jgi:heme exporter protein C
MKSILYSFFGGLVLVLLSYATYEGMIGAPTEATTGDAQRIFYYHVPAAMAAYTLFFINFVASLLFLLRRSERSDAWAAVSAEVGLVFATVVLITGPIWGRTIWNTWWIWDPRLTTFLILWLLYVSYLAVRHKSSGRRSVRVMAAALAIIAFLDVPFSYVANQFRGRHPGRVIGTGHLNSQMGYALIVNMIAFMAFAGLIVWFRYTLEQTSRRISGQHSQKATSGFAAMVGLPAIFSIQLQNLNPTHFMYAAYISAWVIYIAYLLFLLGKVSQLKREESDIARVCREQNTGT